MRNEVQFQSKPDIQKVVLKFESMVEKFGSLTKGKLHGSKPKVTPESWDNCYKC